ncbi:hypothetical protein GH714_041670 [Hevea brasiliensis]|uniref:Uncharacterized protein n=1 Tax=Hevea brasiliensis TaxID=3981 RepID=A0A6A6MWQ2_HEVBR|nr:hypothetical protein GH714_041670 [Hevea brasiliensis]
MEEEFQQNTSAEDVQQQNEQNHGVDELEALENRNGNMNSASGEENQGNEVEGCYQAPIILSIGGGANESNHNIDVDARNDDYGIVQTKTRVIRNPTIVSTRGLPRANRFRSGFRRILHQNSNRGIHGHSRGRGHARGHGATSNNVLTQESLSEHASNVGIRNFDLKIEDGLFDSSSQVAKNWISL